MEILGHCTKIKNFVYYLFSPLSSKSDAAPPQHYYRAAASGVPFLLHPLRPLSTMDSGLYSTTTTTTATSSTSSSEEEEQQQQQQQQQQRQQHQLTVKTEGT